MEYDISIKEALQINKFKIDVASAKHASIYQYFSDLCIEAKKVKDAKEDLLSKLLADKELEFRENPPSNIKPTEGTIKALLGADEEVVSRKLELRDAKAKVYTFDGILKALDHKKDQLRNLTNLYVAGYFSTKESTSMDDEIYEKAKSKAKAGLKNYRRSANGKNKS